MDFGTPVTRWSEFQSRWGGLHNFLMSGEVMTRFDFETPSLERIVEEVRRDERAIFRSGVKQDAFDLTDIPDARTMPLDHLLARPFVLAHFGLHAHLGGKGQIF